MAGMSGVDLGNGEILGSKIHKGRDKSLEYARTPVLEPAPGRNVHLGGGVWRQVCSASDCGAYQDTWGPAWLASPVKRHEHEAHGFDVVGVNVAVLS